MDSHNLRYLGSPDSLFRVLAGIYHTTAPSRIPSPFNSSPHRFFLAEVPREGDFIFTGEEGNSSGSPFFNPRVFFNLLPGAKEDRWLASNLKSSATECIHLPKTFLHGDTSCCSPNTSTRMVGHFPRSEGYLSSHSNPQKSSEIPTIHLPIPVSPFRPFHGPTCLHQNYKGGCSSLPMWTCPSLHLPRRLADSWPIPSDHQGSSYKNSQTQAKAQILSRVLVKIERGA